MQAEADEYLAQRVRLARCSNCRDDHAYERLSRPLKLEGGFQSMRVHCTHCNKYTVFVCCTLEESCRRRFGPIQAG